MNFSHLTVKISKIRYAFNCPMLKKQSDSKLSTEQELSQAKPVERKPPRLKLSEVISFKSVAIITAFVLGSYLLLQMGRSILITSQKVDIFNLARTEVQELRVKNIELILLSERVTSEEYIEESARNRLNYAKDGETLFIIPEELLEDEALDEYVASFHPEAIKLKEAEMSKKPYEVWWELIRYGI